MQIITLKNTINRVPRAQDFAIVEQAVPECCEGEVMVRAVYLSLDPYIGMRLRGRHISGPPPVPMKEAISAPIVGQVVQSRSPLLHEGDWVYVMDGRWAEQIAVDAESCQKINETIAPLRAYVSVLGMPGLTAWAGVTQLAKVIAGDVFLVDASAGTVGGTAGQIARIQGASRVVGIAGGPQKCKLVEDVYGFDTCIDYKKEGWQAALTLALPDGLTSFFENVSAEMAMIAIENAQLYARGVLCGLSNAYHTKEQSLHSLNAGRIIGKRATLSGLVVFDFFPQWDEYIETAATWIADGRLKYAEDFAEGIEQTPLLFEKLMDGANIGKCLVQVAPE